MLLTSNNTPHILSITQGELVDRIEFHVTQASEHVVGGRGELLLAEDYQTKARKVRNVFSSFYLSHVDFS